MSMKLRELIKRVRGCKTAEEERSVINKESADIRNMTKDLKDPNIMTRNLTKCIFMHMLGYQTNFIQMTCVNLLQSTKFTEKRIAYMALCILMDEKSEVLLLTSNSIKKDLISSNHFIVSVALNTIGEVCTPDLCRDLSMEVIKLMTSTNQYIKRKAALAATRIIKRCPDLLESYADKLGYYFDDKNHGVLLAGLSLAIQVFKQDSSWVDKYRKHIGTILKHLRSLVNTSYSPDFDINGVTDPFLQVKYLEILQYFGKGSKKSSEEMNDHLSAVCTSTDNTKNTGNAVLYELVRTIITIESSSGLKSLGSNIIGRFLANRDNNYKYIALITLHDVAKFDLNSVQKHKNTILECLKDPDISIQKRALILIHIITNSNNIKQIVKECLNYALTADSEMKLELTSKMCHSLEKYSPSLKWQVDILIKMLCLCGNFVNEQTTSSIINLIVSTEELHLYAVHKLYLNLKINMGQEGLVKVAVYIIGEFGDILIANSVKNGDDEQINVSEDDVIETLKEILSRKYSTSSVHEYLLNCFMKLSVKYNNSIGTIRLLIEDQKKSYFCEVQQRAIEYSVFGGLKNRSLKNDVTKNIPNSKIVRENIVKKMVSIDEFDEDVDEDKNTIIKLETDKVIQRDLSQIDTNISKPTGGNSNLLDLESIFSSAPSSGSGNPTGITNDNLMTNIIDPNKKSSNNDLDSIFSSINLTSNNSSATSSNVTQSANLNSNNTLNNLDIFSQITSAYSSNPTTNPTSNNININNADKIDLNIMDNPLLDLNLDMNNSSNTTKNVMPFQTQHLNQTGYKQTMDFKQFFTNNEISLYCSASKTENNANINAIIFISSNSDSELTNVKLSLSVIKKQVDLKVINTSGFVLTPRQKNGITKEISMTNSQPEKKVVVRIKYSYTSNNKEITDTITFDEL